MRKLDDSEMFAHKQSLLDWRGQLFEMDGQLYRAIPPAYSKFYVDLLSSDLASQLFSCGLIGTTKTNYVTSDCPLVLAHDRIDFVSIWTEWSSLMLRDAALMVCDLNSELVAHGYGTQDGHPWNVLFDYTSPRFVDFTSIVELKEFTDRWLNEWLHLFRRCWIIPLALMSMNQFKLARSVNRAIDVDEPIDTLFSHRLLRWFPLSFAINARKARIDPARFFKDMHEHLASLPLRTKTTEWSDYYQYTGHPAHSDTENYPPKAKVVSALLQRLRPATVIDIGCNKGWYSVLAAELGAKVVAIDNDEDCINGLYQEAKKRSLKILPLLMDSSVPTPRHGRKVEFPAATERLKGEVGLMLALIHHLVFTVRLNFKRIAELFAKYCTKYAIVEFVPPEDKFVAEWMRPEFAWYTLANFTKEMEQYFELIEVFESNPPRSILLFKKLP